MARNYSFMYNKVVHDDADIIGHIAYSMYKDEKIRFIENFKKEHNGGHPTEEDIKYFNDINSTDSSIERYRFSASLVLQSFLDSSLSETINSIETDMNQRHLEEMKGILKPVRSFWKGVGQSIVGAFAFMLIICLLIFFLRFSDYQYTFTFGGNGNASLTEETIVQETNCENEDK